MWKTLTIVLALCPTGRNCGCRHFSATPDLAVETLKKSVYLEDIGVILDTHFHGLRTDGLQVGVEDEVNCCFKRQNRLVRRFGMTAEELIKRLKSLPPETPVLVEGYETGYDEIINLTTQEVIRYRNAQEWDGEFQAPDKFTETVNRFVSAALIVGRRGHLR